MMTAQEFGEAFQNGGYQRTVRFLQGGGADRDLASELAQAAWVRGWERLGQLRDERYVVQWVNAIARSLLITSFRRPQSMDLSHLVYEPGVPPSVNVAEIDMRRGIERCKPHERRSLEAYMDGYSHDERAAETGKSPAAIHAEVYRARRALREQLHVSPRQVLQDERVSRKKVQREKSAGLPKASGA